MKPATAVFLALCLSACSILKDKRADEASSEPWQPLATCAETRPVPDAASGAAAGARVGGTQTSHGCFFTADGYGATPEASRPLTPGQRKLAAMRAAEVDAYRKLAEQVHGFNIDGRTTVADFVAQNDAIRAWVEALVRGARIVSNEPVEDGNYKATVELVTPPDFPGCLAVATCPVAKKEKAPEKDKPAPATSQPQAEPTPSPVAETTPPPTSRHITRPHCVSGCVDPAQNYAN